MDGWSSLGASKEEPLENLTGKCTILIGDSITKNKERFTEKVKLMEVRLQFLWDGMVRLIMQNYWNQLRQGEKATNSETSFQNNLAMTWGTMCEKSAMATYISKFLSRTYPKSKVSETGVHIVNDENGILWLASSPDGLAQTGKITDGLGVVEIKCRLWEANQYHTEMFVSATSQK